VQPLEKPIYQKQVEDEDMAAFVEYIDLNENIQRRLDHALELVDTARGYVGELKTARAVFCAIIESLQVKIQEFKCQALEQ
jgi:hypothetical protein